MRKFWSLILLVFVLTGCAESMVMLGPMSGAAGGNVARSSFSSAVSYGIQKQTVKSPIEHLLNQKKENKNSADLKKNKFDLLKKDIKLVQNCLSFLEPMSADACTDIKNRILNLSKVKNLN